MHKFCACLGLCLNTGLFMLFGQFDVCLATANIIKIHVRRAQKRIRWLEGIFKKFDQIQDCTRYYLLSLLYCFILTISLIDIQFIRVKYLLHPCKINLYISDRHQPFPYFILFISLLDIVVDRLGPRSNCQGLSLGQSLSLNPH